jgi:hypothetical protein
MKRWSLILSFLLVTTNIFAQTPFGHGKVLKAFKITSDTTVISKETGRAYFYTGDSLFYVAVDGLLKQIACEGDTIAFSKVKLDTLEGWSTDSVFVNDDFVLLKNILFKGTTSNYQYYVDASGDTILVINPNAGPVIDLDFAESGNAADGTHYVDDLVTMSADPAASAEVDGGYFAINKSNGANGTYTLNGVEGVVRSQYADESMTARGVYGRFYIDPTASATLRTGIGGEFSARAGYAGGEIAAESGTAFVGLRIWMAPYFTAGTIANVNNFHGLWLYNEATDKTVTNGIMLNDAGGTGGWTNGLNFSGATLTNEIVGSQGEYLRNTTNNKWETDKAFEADSLNSRELTVTDSTFSDTLATNMAYLGTISADSLNLRELTVTDSAWIDTLTAAKLRISDGVEITDGIDIFIPGVVSNRYRIYNDGGGFILEADSSGRFSIGGIANTRSTTSWLTLNHTEANPLTYNNNTLNRFAVSQTSGAFSGMVQALQNELWLTGDNTQDWTATDGLQASVNRVELRSGSSGSITGASSVRSEVEIANGLTLGNHYGFRVTAKTGTGILTNQYGLYVEDLTGGTLNYGIYQAGTNDANYFGSATTFNDQIYVNNTLSRLYSLGGNSRFVQKASSGDSVWITIDDDTARVNSNNPIKIGTSSLIISSTGNIIVDNFTAETINADSLYFDSGNLVYSDTEDSLYANKATVATEAYDATGWNGNNTVPTKDAVRDEIESVVSNGLLKTDFGDSLANYDGDGLEVKDNDAINVLVDYDGGIETTDDSLNIKLNGSTLTIGSSGLSVTNDPADRLLKVDFGDSLVNYDGYGVTITDNADIEVDTSQIATQYDISQKQNLDANLTALAADSMYQDGGTLVFSPTANQLYGYTEYPPPWSVSLDSPANMTADTTWFRPIEFYGASGVTLDSIRVEATTDDQDVNLIKRARTGGSIAVVDAITASNDGIGEVFFQTETTLTTSTLANNERLGMTKPSTASDNVLIIVFYHYTKQPF